MWAGKGQGEGVTNEGYIVWTSTVWAFSPWCWAAIYTWPSLLALLLFHSTGQMDDVLDYICTFHHSRDIHRHLSLLVSTSRIERIFKGTCCLVRGETWERSKTVSNFNSEQGSRCRDVNWNIFSKLVYKVVVLQVNIYWMALKEQVLFLQYNNIIWTR